MTMSDDAPPIRVLGFRRPRSLMLLSRWVSAAMLLSAIAHAGGEPAPAPPDSSSDPVAAAVADARLAIRPAADPGEVQRAVARLSEYPPEAVRAAVAVLVEAMASDNLKVRAAAFDALGFVGPDAEAGIPQLLAVVRDGGRDSREHGSAVIALGRIRRRSDEVVPVLAQGLRSRDEDERLLAVYALMMHGPAGAPAVPALLELLRHPPGKYDRSAAARALGGIGPAAAPAVPDLLEMVHGPESFDRGTAAEALGGIGASDAATLHALVSALGDGDEGVVRSVLLALGQLGPKASAAAQPAVRDVHPTKKTELALAYARVRLGDADAGLARLRELARADPPAMEVFDTIGMLKE